MHESKETLELTTQLIVNTPLGYYLIIGLVIVLELCILYFIKNSPKSQRITVIRDITHAEAMLTILIKNMRIGKVGVGKHPIGYGINKNHMSDILLYYTDSILTTEMISILDKALAVRGEKDYQADISDMEPGLIAKMMLKRHMY